MPFIILSHMYTRSLSAVSLRRLRLMSGIGDDEAEYTCSSLCLLAAVCLSTLFDLLVCAVMCKHHCVCECVSVCCSGMRHRWSRQGTEILKEMFVIVASKSWSLMSVPKQDRAGQGCFHSSSLLFSHSLFCVAVIVFNRR